MKPFSISKFLVVIDILALPVFFWQMLGNLSSEYPWVVLGVFLISTFEIFIFLLQSKKLGLENYPLQSNDVMLPVFSMGFCLVIAILGEGLIQTLSIISVIWYLVAFNRYLSAGRKRFCEDEYKFSESDFPDEEVEAGKQ